MKIACVGEAMIELSIAGAAASGGVAGDTLNTGVYLKRTAPDLQVDYVTRLGDCPFSEQIRDFIAEQDLGTDTIEMISGETPGLYAITSSETGERSFTYWRGMAAARGLFHGGDFSVLDPFDVVYLSGISLAILPDQVRRGLLDYLKAQKTAFAFDSNYRPRLWENPQTAKAMTEAFWRRADIALPSIDDEMALFAEDEAAVVERFALYGSRGAMKRGASGPLALGADIAQDYPEAPKVVDTTAAGDSFNGGYLGAILKGASQAEALMAGHTCAAEVVQHRGAITPR